MLAALAARTQIGQKPIWVLGFPVHWLRGFILVLTHTALSVYSAGSVHVAESAGPSLKSPSSPTPPQGILNLLRC